MSRTVCDEAVVIDIGHSASGPVSPVLILTACSRLVTKIFPSPTLPVFAAFSIASMAFTTRSSSRAISSLIFG